VFRIPVFENVAPSLNFVKIEIMRMLSPMTSTLQACRIFPGPTNDLNLEQNAMTKGT
jgi:hypothetical protein